MSQKSGEGWIGCSESELLDRSPQGEDGDHLFPDLQPRRENMWVTEASGVALAGNTPTANVYANNRSNGAGCDGTDMSGGLMRRGIACGLFTCCFFLQIAHSQVGNGESSMFLLDKADGATWCSFSSGSVWRERVSSLHSSDVAILRYKSKRITSIEFTQQADSGDWIVYDTYTIEDGHVVELHRKSNILPGDVSVQQVFRFRENKPVLENTTVLGLRTGKPSDAHDFSSPEVPVLHRLSDFPFATLLSANYVEPHNGTCAAATDDATVRQK